MIYADANFLDALVLNVPDRSEVATRAVRKDDLWASPMALYELRKSLAGRAAQVKRTARDNLAELLESDLKTLPPDWSEAVARAEQIAEDFGARLAVDSADTLHVAWALHAGCTAFASFDRRSGPRALAKALGLQVIPPMTAADWQEKRRLKPD